jgi:F-type H+-transporting ATPase subunit b
MYTQVVSRLALLLALMAPAAALGAGKTHAPESDAQTPAKTAEGAHAEAPNPLEWKKELAIWSAVVFVVLFLALWKFAWGPISQGLNKRERGIADQIAQAEQANQQAKELLAEYEQKLAASREEVRGILEQGRRDAEKVGREMLDKARGDAQAEQQRALRQIDAATASALKELADRSATLAVELAGKIVQAKINPAEHAKLIEQAVASFAAKEPSKN